MRIYRIRRSHPHAGTAVCIEFRSRDSALEHEKSGDDGEESRTASAAHVQQIYILHWSSFLEGVVHMSTVH